MIWPSCQNSFQYSRPQHNTFEPGGSFALQLSGKKKSSVPAQLVSRNDKELVRGSSEKAKYSFAGPTWADNRQESAFKEIILTHPYVNHNLPGYDSRQPKEIRPPESFRFVTELQNNRLYKITAIILRKQHLIGKQVQKSTTVAFWLHPDNISNICLNLIFQTG